MTTDIAELVRKLRLADYVLVRQAADALEARQARIAALEAKVESEVRAGHELVDNGRWGPIWRCGCDWMPPDGPKLTDVGYHAHAAHVNAEVAKALETEQP